MMIEDDDGELLCSHEEVEKEWIEFMSENYTKMARDQTPLHQLTKYCASHYHV